LRKDQTRPHPCGAFFLILAQADSDPNDFSSWRVNLTSDGLALLMLFLFSDVDERDLETLGRDKERFYSTSFEKDPLSVSEVLLRWRDSLSMAGWNGTSRENSKRLNDLAEMDRALKEAVAPGLPDRLVAVRDSVDLRHHAIEQVCVIDPPSAFPLWPQIQMGSESPELFRPVGLLPPGARSNEPETRVLMD
jgi:hypothetical protein